MTRDPIGYGDGLNVYLYVHNNPINHVDPLGLAIGDWYDPQTYWVGRQGFAESVTQQSESFAGTYGAIIRNVRPTDWNKMGGDIAAQYENSALGQSKNADPVTKYGTRAALTVATVATAVAIKQIIVDIIVEEKTRETIKSDATPDPANPEQQKKQQPDEVYHYTASKEEEFKDGIRSQTHATDEGNLTPDEAVDRAGTTRKPDKVVVIDNSGGEFQPGKPEDVTEHKAGKGGAKDFVNEERVPPGKIREIRPLDDKNK